MGLAALLARPLVGQDSAAAAVGEAPVLRAPFASTDVTEEADRSATIAWQLELAQSAMRGGFHTLAERFYLSVRGSSEIDDEIRMRAAMGHVDALIGQGRGQDAAAALEALAGEPNAGWNLRRAVAHYLVASSIGVEGELQRREFAGMAERIRELHPEDVGRDASWLFFLRGSAATRAGDQSEAARNFQRATSVATSEAERSIFELAKYQAALTSAPITQASVNSLVDNIERQQGNSLGMQFTLQYAVMLDRMDEKARAISVLKRQRETMPAREVDLRDKTLLVLGLIAGVGTDDGRNAFRELLERGKDIDFQRIALMRLAAPARGDAAAAAADLRRLITTLLSRPEPHPLTEDLLYFRAELALRARPPLFEEAEADAQAVLTRFPGSTRLRREALGILASSSWQRLARYRTAADYLARIRALPGISATDRARLALLQGECYFRAGVQDNTVEDFRNAAEAYAAVQTEGTMPEDVSPGVVFYQRVLSLLRARSLDGALRVLDDPEARLGVDIASWWQAEWNLARELQLAGRTAEALRRADSMGPAAGVPPEMQLRFLWLAAHVSLGMEPAEATEARVALVRQFLEGEQGALIAAETRSAVLSNAGLVAAEARLREGQREAGRLAIERLRTEFPDSPAADYSFIVEAGFLAGENRLVEAMQLLLRLADTRHDSIYAPEALYQAALLGIQRGYLDDANRLLDQLAERYPNENYVFQAKLKQADLKRSLGHFSEAELIYENLEDGYPNHGDRAILQISLAGALMAQASADPGKFVGAVSRFERLMANESLPVDLRAEAGAQLAAGWQAQGNSARAAEICWEVNRRFVEDPEAAANLGATGPYWISRALFLLGEIEEKEGRYDDARRLYQSLIDRGLPGDKVAMARLAKLNAPAGGG